MSNLLQETIECLKKYGKIPEDVIWVGNREQYSITWQEFSEISDFYYNDGFGSEEICLDLKIVGEDFWLERHEYDGSEWWEFKTMPKKPENSKKFHCVKVINYGRYLSENQNHENETEK